jgi:hypothetical protein
VENEGVQQLAYNVLPNVASVGVQGFSFFREILPALATATQSKKLRNPLE